MPAPTPQSAIRISQSSRSDYSLGHESSSRYPCLYNLLPLIGGLIDPPMGVIGTLSRLIRPYRIDPRADSARRRRRGICFVLGGIEGLSQYGMAMVHGLLAGGYRGSVVQFPWNRCIPIAGVFRNLMSSAHHERKSDELVQLIREYRRDHPDAPVSFLAQSGGCYVTIRTLEKLPPDLVAHRAVLLAPSVSPGYDIRPAAARCRGGLYSLGGPGDFFFLGLGTILFGTSDRVHTPAAGLVGWHFKSSDFTELRWHPRWLRHGYLGNHLTTSHKRFVAGAIGPILHQVSTTP